MTALVDPHEIIHRKVWLLACYLLLLHWLIPAYGNHGLFLGLMLFMLIRVLTLLFYFPGIDVAIRDSNEKPI